MKIKIMRCQCNFEIVNSDYNFCPGCGRSLKDKQNLHANDWSRLLPQDYIKQVSSIGHKFSSERRIVTIMFVDIVGSTSISETRDPEEVIDIVNQVFQVICHPILERQGTIARFMGDGLLCFFGAPESHEDDPYRACQAALEIIEEINKFKSVLKDEHGLTDFAVRIGINTDLVVVGEVGSANRVEYTAMGDGINIAARLESKAEPNRILISEKTKRFIESKFDTESKGLIQVKGISKPIEVFELKYSKDETAVAESYVSESEFVGRENEIKLLTDLLNDNFEYNDVIWITGDAGIGKTRLLHECCHKINSGKNSHFLNCSTSTREKDYYILKRISDVFDTNKESSNNENIIEKIDKNLKSIEANANVIIIIDDFQWIDRQSLEGLKKLVPSFISNRIQLIMSGRLDNEFMLSFVDWVLKREDGGIKKIDIQPLSYAETEKLYQVIAAKNMLPSNVKKVICENSKGNPFFLRVLTQSILDQMLKSISDDKNSLLGYHVDTVKIPRSLQGAVIARIDQLEPLAKLLLKYASAMGGELNKDILRKLSESFMSEIEFEKHIENLLNYGYISREEGHYKFTNNLVAESIYKSLLRSQREELKDQIKAAQNELNNKT